MDPDLSYVTFLKDAGVHSAQGISDDPVLPRVADEDFSALAVRWGVSIEEAIYLRSSFQDMFSSPYVFDIGDEDFVSVAVERVSSDLYDVGYVGKYPCDGSDPSGFIVHKRGTEGYYRQHISPRIEELHDVADKLGLIGYFGAFISLTTDTKRFASQTSAWLFMKENSNRIMSWARKGATGDRSRVYHLESGLFSILYAQYGKDPSRFVQLDPDTCSVRFSNARPRVHLYLRVAEDTEARYPAPHVLVFFSRSDFVDLPITEVDAVRLFNDELSCVCDKQGFTHLSEDFKYEFNDPSSAVSYCTKYLGKQMNPLNSEYDSDRGLSWMVCLKSVGVRMYSMSNSWRVLYNDLHGIVSEVRSDRSCHPHEGVDPCGVLSVTGLNSTYIDNSNVSKPIYKYFGESFPDLFSFLKFFSCFVRDVDPPPADPPRVLTGIVPILSDKHSDLRVVDDVVPVVSTTGFSELLRKDTKGALVFDSATVQTMMTFSDDHDPDDEEISPVWFGHCKCCKHFARCPRHSCRSSVSCIHCCCSEAQILSDDGVCDIGIVAFPGGFNHDIYA